MRHSAIALALSAGVATCPVLAGKDTQLEFSYVMRTDFWLPRPDGVMRRLSML
jgi:hypothetical protein